MKLLLGLNLIIPLAILAGMVCPGLVHADGNEVVVVYNSALPESKAVADYYVHARNVPKDQEFGFSLPTGLEITRKDFQEKLQVPLADKLVAKNLWRPGDIFVPEYKGRPAHMVHGVVSTRIRYLVLCYGVPERIPQDDSLQESFATNLPPQFRPNTASVDSELVWLPALKTNPPLDGPMNNWIYGATNQLMLSPTNGILLVARLDGPSADIARGLVDKAMTAERDGLWGRAYFDTRGLAPTDSYYYGDKVILGASEICAHMGYEVSVDTNSATFPASYPLSQVAVYCGWYDWSASGPFTRPQVEFMPGAIAYHLHSFSAADIRSYSNNWVGPLLAKGATCTMGCVNEPYLGYTPNLIIFFGNLARGWTFGEAAWAAQAALSWQTTVVGDPLYRPYGRSPGQLHEELQKRNSPLLEWSWLQLVDMDQARGGPLRRLAGFLEELPATTNSAVLSEKLADLNEDLGKPASAIDYYEQALKLNPSLQQRIRLRLTLGTDLTTQNRAAEAADDYRQLLREAPDYPDKAKIEDLLVQLEPKLARPPR